MAVFRLLLQIISVCFRVIESVGFVLDLFSFLQRNQQRSVRKTKDPVLKLPAVSLTRKIKKRIVTAEHVLRTYIHRIHEVNPILNAIVSDRFVEALEEAKNIDRILDSQEILLAGEKALLLQKPLLGVPVTVKESISCKNLPNSSGLVDRKDEISEQNAGVVENLRTAGAIPVAVTNCSELCMWWETVNNVYGRTNNPYDTSRIVGGSSGGEGAIIASAGSVCGIGSDVGGSVRMPAFFNGIYGHKPSPNVVPTDGHFPRGKTETFNEYLSIGPMCRYAEDLVPMLRAMAGENVPNLQLDKPVDISSLKVYVIDDEVSPAMASSVDSELKRAQERLCSYLVERFKVKIQKISPKLFRYSPLIWAASVISNEDEDFICQMLEHKSCRVNPFIEIPRYLTGYSKYHYVTVTVVTLEYIKRLMPNVVSNFVSMGEKLMHEMEELLGNDGVLLYPSHPNTALPHHRPFLAPLNFSYTAIFNILHLPVTQCPLGLDRGGLPLGIQIAAARNNDHLTLTVAKALREEFGDWDSWEPGSESMAECCDTKNKTL